jgi:hypothetical protein
VPGQSYIGFLLLVSPSSRQDVECSYLFRYLNELHSYAIFAYIAQKRRNFEVYLFPDIKDQGSRPRRREQVRKGGAVTYTEPL